MDLSVKWDQLIKAAYAVVEAGIVQVWDPGRFMVGSSIAFWLWVLFEMFYVFPVVQVPQHRNSH